MKKHRNPQASVSKRPSPGNHGAPHALARAVTP